MLGPKDAVYSFLSITFDGVSDTGAKKLDNIECVLVLTRNQAVKAVPTSTFFAASK